MTAITPFVDLDRRGHIAVLQIIFGIAPIALASIGAVVAWRGRHRLLVVTCLLALALYPALHLWTANFVSAQKHVVAGFLLGLSADDDADQSKP